MTRTQTASADQDDACRRPAVAVVGAGVSGLAAAWLLQRNGFRVTLFEASPELGGHALTVELPDLPPVDLGFQVFNLTTYPHLVGLLRELKVDTAVSDMSFACSVQAPGGARRFEWASHNLLTVFPSLRSAVDQSRYRLVWDVLRFGRRAQADAPHYETVGSYVSAMGFGAVFVNAYLLPMIAAIWSVPTKTAMAMPLQSLVHFMANHHLLSTGWPPRPTWRVITNRSREYVQRIRAALRDVRVGCPISRVVERDVSGVVLQDGDGDHHRFDKVVLAVHADTALKILGRHASKEERSQLTAIRYQPNRCVLHHDKSLMPRNRRLWASWNSMGSANDEDPVTCTYWLNRLQNLPADCPDLFLTLNPARDPESVLGVYTLDHPVLDGDAVRAQGAIRQGVGSVYFAGAWLGFGFHEDGMKSAVRVVRELISVDTTPSRVVPWEMHTPSPVPHSLTSYLAMKLCAMYLRRGIRKGKLRIVLPNGNELRFGEGDDDGRHRTSAVMIVHTLDAFVRIAAQGSIGLGLAYVRGQFDVDGDGESALTDLLACNLASLTETQAWLGPFSAIAGFWAARRHLRRTKNTPEQSRENVRAHYDIGNDMYELILGSTMMYSCAEFADADDAAGDDQAMDAAQKRKLQSIMVQADLRPGHHVLEIGCGWGGMALHAARCIPSIRWTGITLSEEQKAYCDRCIAEAGLQDRIEILLVDYRRFAAEHAGQFDRVVSIEMIEGVGHENLPTYFEAIRVVLAPAVGSSCRRSRSPTSGTKLTGKARISSASTSFLAATCPASGPCATPAGTCSAWSPSDQ